MRIGSMPSDIAWTRTKLSRPTGRPRDATIHVMSPFRRSRLSYAFRTASSTSFRRLVRSDGSHARASCLPRNRIASVRPPIARGCLLQRAIEPGSNPAQVPFRKGTRSVSKGKPSGFDGRRETVPKRSRSGARRDETQADWWSRRHEPIDGEEDASSDSREGSGRRSLLLNEGIDGPTDTTAVFHPCTKTTTTYQFQDRWRELHWTHERVTRSTYQLSSVGKME